MVIKETLTAEDSEDFAEAAEKNTSFAFLCVDLCALCGKNGFAFINDPSYPLICR